MARTHKSILKLNSGIPGVYTHFRDQKQLPCFFWVKQKIVLVVALLFFWLFLKYQTPSLGVAPRLESPFCDVIWVPEYPFIDFYH